MRRLGAAIALLLALAGCQTLPTGQAATLKSSSSCAANAYRAMDTPRAAEGEEAAQLATRCTDEFLKRALRDSSRRWSEGPSQIGDLRLTVEDLERYGPSVIVDHHSPDGDRILVWSK